MTDIEVVDPSTEEPFASVVDVEVAGASAAVDSAAAAFPEWSDTAPRVRSTVLRRAFELMVERSDELAETIVRENGKPIAEARGEVAYAAEFFRWFSEEAVRLHGSVVRAPGGGGHQVVMLQPVGVSYLITPWNFPAAMLTRKVGPALAAGCTVVLKAAPDTPLVTLALGELIANHTDIPAGVVNVISGADPAVGAALTTSPDVDMVTFTGSTPTGRAIMAAASGTLKRVFLELGGKSAFLVLDDADVAGACARAAFTASMHAGQGCAITTRLVVPRARYDEAVAAAAGTMGGIKPGDPSSPRTVCGPVISARQRDRVQSYLDLAIAEGGMFACGGGRPADRDTGFFIEPTVIAGLDNSARVAREEIFGPVLTVIAHDGDDDAVRIANDSPYGLSGTVFSADPQRAAGVAARLRVGTVNVNGGVWYSADAPFGGYKQSGNGREMGIAGFEEYLETKCIATLAT